MSRTMKGRQLMVDEFGVGDCPGVLRFSPPPPYGYPQCFYGLPSGPAVNPPVCIQNCVGDTPPDVSKPPHTVPEPSTLVLMMVAIGIVWCSSRSSRVNRIKGAKP